VSSPDDFETYDWTVEPPTYEPSITSSSFDDDKQEVTIGWEVENTGNFADGEKDIRFIVNGQQEKLIEKEISPNTPETGTETFSVSGPSPLPQDGDIINVTVATEDASASTAPGKIAVDPHYFNPIIDDATFTAASPGTSAKVTVNYTIKNTGDFPGTQDIEFLFNGNVKATNDTVTLDADGSTSSTFGTTVEQSDLNDSNQFTVGVRTENTTVKETLSAQPATFEITSSSFGFQEATSSEPAKVTVDYTVENTGDFTDRQDIEFLVNGNVEAEFDPNGETKLAPGQKTPGGASAHTVNVNEGQLEYHPEIGDRGFNLTLSTDNNTTTAYKEAKASFFDITITSSNFNSEKTNKPAKASVNYDVTNTGDFTATKDITVLVDGNPVNSHTDPLTPDETLSDGFVAEVDESDINPNGKINLTVKSSDTELDDSETRLFDVKRPDFEFTNNPTYDFTSASAPNNRAQVSGDFEVINTGDFIGDVRVDFNVEGTNRDNKQWDDVAPGETRSTTLTHTPDPAEDINVGLELKHDGVTDDDDSDTIEDKNLPEFSIASADFSINNNDEPTVDYTIQNDNNADFAGKVDPVKLKVDDEEEADGSTPVVYPGQTTAEQTLTSGNPVSYSPCTTNNIDIAVTFDKSGPGNGKVKENTTKSVEGPCYEVWSITNVNYNQNKEEVSFDYEIKNTGDVTGSSQNIVAETIPESRFNSGSSTSTSRSIDPGNIYDNNNVVLGISDADTYDLKVSTGNDQCDPDLSPIDPQPSPVNGCPEITVSGPQFDINIQSFDDQVFPPDEWSPTQNPTAAEFTYRVTNTGDLSGTQDILFCEDVFSCQGRATAKDYNQLTLNPGETSNQFTFTGKEAARGDTPSIEYEIKSNYETVVKDVAVLIQPEFTSFDLKDKSTANCQGVNIFGGCFSFSGGWEENVEYKLDYTIDDPSGIADEVVMNIENPDGGNIGDITRTAPASDGQSGQITYDGPSRETGFTQNTQGVFFEVGISTSVSGVGGETKAAFDQTTGSDPDPGTYDAVVRVDVNDKSSSNDCGLFCTNYKPKYTLDWEVSDPLNNGVDLDSVSMDVVREDVNSGFDRDGDDPGIVPDIYNSPAVDGSHTFDFSTKVQNDFVAEITVDAGNDDIFIFGDPDPDGRYVSSP
jgi:hypothetical protein